MFGNCILKKTYLCENVFCNDLAHQFLIRGERFMDQKWQKSDSLNTDHGYKVITARYRSRSLRIWPIFFCLNRWKKSITNKKQKCVGSLNITDFWHKSWVTGNQNKLNPDWISAWEDNNKAVNDLGYSHEKDRLDVCILISQCIHSVASQQTYLINAPDSNK